MGEKISVLTKGVVKSKWFEIELNKPHSSQQFNSIHIQTDSFRWEFSEKDFIKLSTIILDSIKKLKEIKKI